MEALNRGSSPEVFAPLLTPWYLSGPTASGKTSVAIELAKKLGAEIVSADSMALYRGMDVGTAKPSTNERREVPHHLIDMLDPTESFSLGQYVAEAHRVIRQIESAHKPVLVVGGTPLYMKALLRGVFVGPPADFAFREKLAQEAAQQPPGYLHAKLAQVDAKAAARLHPNDPRRIIRALEVYEKLGRPLSELQQQFEKGTPAALCRVFVLDRAKEDLRRRIEDRVAEMFCRGLVEEVRGLLARYGRLSPTASQAVGYREVLTYLSSRSTLEETILLVKRHTWQLARRQRIWFRSLCECRFVPVSAGESAAEIADRILQMAQPAEKRPGIN